MLSASVALPAGHAAGLSHNVAPSRGTSRGGAAPLLATTASATLRPVAVTCMPSTVPAIAQDVLPADLCIGRSQDENQWLRDRKPMDPFFYPTTIKPLTSYGLSAIEQTTPPKVNNISDAYWLSDVPKGLEEKRGIDFVAPPWSTFVDQPDDNQRLQEQNDSLARQIQALDHAKSWAAIQAARQQRHISSRQEQIKREAELARQRAKEVQKELTNLDLLALPKSPGLSEDVGGLPSSDLGGYPESPSPPKDSIAQASGVNRQFTPPVSQSACPTERTTQTSRQTPSSCGAGDNAAQSLKDTPSPPRSLPVEVVVETGYPAERELSGSLQASSVMIAAGGARLVGINEAATVLGPAGTSPPQPLQPLQPQMAGVAMAAGGAAVGGCADMIQCNVAATEPEGLPENPVWNKEVWEVRPVPVDTANWGASADNYFGNLEPNRLTNFEPVKLPAEDVPANDISTIANCILNAHQTHATFGSADSPMPPLAPSTPATQLYVDAMGNSLGQPVVLNLPNIKDDPATEQPSAKPDLAPFNDNRFAAPPAVPPAVRDGPQIATSGPAFESIMTPAGQTPLTATPAGQTPLALGPAGSASRVSGRASAVSLGDKRGAGDNFVSEANQEQGQTTTARDGSKFGSAGGGSSSGSAAAASIPVSQVVAPEQPLVGGVGDVSGVGGSVAPPPEKAPIGRTPQPKSAAAAAKSEPRRERVAAKSDGAQPLQGQKANAVNQEVRSEELQAELEECLDTISWCAESVTKDSLQDFKNTNKPATIIKDVLETVAMLIGQPETNWDKLRRLVAAPAFTERIQKLNFQKNITREQFKKLRERLQHPEFDEEFIKTVCVPIVPLATWCRAIGVYLSKTKFRGGPEIRPVAGAGAASPSPYQGVGRQRPPGDKMIFTPEIERLSAEELRKVADLTISRPEVGKITFHGDTDCTEIDFEAAVRLEIGEVLVYPDSTTKPPVGVGLNKAATVTMYQCWPPNASKLLQDPKSKDRYKKKIKQMTEEKNATFIDYDCGTGIWKFSVDHF